MLSRARKEVFIKAVAQSIPTYTRGVFQLPIKLCDELNSMSANFWWGHIGRVGVSCLNQRNKKEWDFKIFGILILQC